MNHTMKRKKEPLAETSIPPLDLVPAWQKQRLLLREVDSPLIPDVLGIVDEYLGKWSSFENDDTEVSCIEVPIWDVLHRSRCRRISS